MAKLNTKEYDRVYSLVNNTLNNTVKAALIKKYSKKLKKFIQDNPPSIKDNNFEITNFDYYSITSYLDITHIQEHYKELRKDFDAELNKYNLKRDKFMLKISLDDKSAIKELDKFLKELEEVSKNVQD